MHAIFIPVVQTFQISNFKLLSEKETTPHPPLPPPGLKHSRICNLRFVRVLWTSVIAVPSKDCQPISEFGFQSATYLRHDLKFLRIHFAEWSHRKAIMKNALNIISWNIVHRALIDQNAKRKEVMKYQYLVRFLFYEFNYDS